MSGIEESESRLSASTRAAMRAMRDADRAKQAWSVAVEACKVADISGDPDDDGWAGWAVGQAERVSLVAADSAEQAGRAISEEDT